MTNCERCGHSMQRMKFADESTAKLTCPDCGWRKGEPTKSKMKTKDYTLSEAEIILIRDALIELKYSTPKERHNALTVLITQFKTDARTI